MAISTTFTHTILNPTMRRDKYDDIEETKQFTWIPIPLGTPVELKGLDWFKQYVNCFMLPSHWLGKFFLPYN